MADTNQDQEQSVSFTRRDFLGMGAAAVAMQSSISMAVDVESSIVWNYANQLSYKAGEKLQVHVSSDSPKLDVRIDRVGLKRETVWSRSGIDVDQHPIPKDASANGCRWPVALEIEIPSDWKSGYYEIETNPGSGNNSYFIIRPEHPGRNAKILLQMSTNTDSAYNNWGGYSLYSYNGKDKVQGRRVSMHRPMSGSTIRRWELPFVRWAESAGYDIDYCANNDLEFHPELLKHYSLVLSVGHDEYWSTPMRDSLEKYIAAGGNVAFFSGNTCCWQVRNEESGMAQVCFKQYYEEDPLYKPDGPNPLLATLWSHHLLERPENSLTGVGVRSGGFHLSHGQYMDGSGAHTVHQPDHWVFCGTGLAKDQQFGAKDTILGYECDGCEYEIQDGIPVPTGKDGTPKDFQILASGPACWGPEEGLLWYDRWPKDQQGAGCMGLYTSAGGGTVFTAGTTDWPHGLGDQPDPAVDRITRNILNRLGEKPTATG